MSPGVEHDQDTRWKAVVERDPRADGSFVFAVRTTGICCRPSCSARRPNRENVLFFDDVAAAQAAGFRACKRCRPGDDSVREQRVQLVERLCRRLETEEPAPQLQDLARTARMSPERLRRLFEAVLGVTPREYMATARVQRVGDAMQDGATVTSAMHAAGYASTSSFHRETSARLGMLPKQRRKGGEGVQMKVAVCSCSLGLALIATTERGVCAVLLGDDERDLLDDLHARFPNAQCECGDDEHRKAIAGVLAVVEGNASDPGLPLHVRGTAFQQLVWQELRNVQAGEFVDYTELARRIGKPAAHRAVAGACAKNPLAVLVPCHRVLRKDGSLSGYRWGVERKRALLQREGVSLP